MKLACTSWSFPALTLPEVAGVARVLGLDAVDVGVFYTSSLDRARLVEAPEEYGAQLQLDLPISNVYYLFGTDIEERNLADPASLEANTADFKQVLRFCQAAHILSVMLLPGVLNPGQSRNDALETSAAALQTLVALATQAGVTLVVEPHVHSFLESPALTLALLERVPGLQLALDYAHFVCLGYRQEEIDVLAPFAGHVHLRQARSGVLQAKLAQGTINFPAVLATLRAGGYSGYLALEYVHQDYMNTLHDDVLTETVQLRDLVRRFV